MKEKNLAYRSLPRRLPHVSKEEGFFDEIMENNRSVSEIIFANLIVFSAVFLAMFIPFLSLGLPIVLLLYFQVGLWGFVYLKESDKKYKYENLFVSLKYLVKIFCISVIKLFATLFGMLCLIVPGIVYLLNHCFCALIMFESPDLDVKGVLMLSKELAKGSRLKILFFFFFCLATICVAMSLMFSIIVLFDVFLYVPSTVYIVLVIFAGLLDMFTLALPLFEVVVADCYISAKKRLCHCN